MAEQMNELNGNIPPRIVDVNIEEQMKTSYIDYSMSVIVGRALPDVRDGFKPVHRRILFAMNELGITYDKPHKKSARIVGEVLGKYHPHGDTAVYDAMVRMGQDWSMRYTAIDGQGNFGAPNGDGPAAMRYTEARLKKMSDHILVDIEKETVDFQYNFDDTLQEPTVLPTRIPQLIINGSSGIAVGMATNMMPHNLSEVIDACIAYIDNKEITIDEIMKFIKAPDFPTGGTIYGIEGIKQAMHTGRGRVVLRGTATIEPTKNGREEIVISEVPYQITTDNLTSRIGQLVNDKLIDGISDVTNQSNKDGTRIVIEVKKDAVAQIVLNQLYKQTELQTSYGINNVAIVKGRPKTLNIKDLISEFIEFRHEVILRRTKFDLRKAEERLHILKGFMKALDHLDEVIRLIRQSNNPENAKAQLIGTFEFSDIQAKAILEMRLQRLTGMEREKIKQEYDDTILTVNNLKEILGSEYLQYNIIKTELVEVKEKFGDERKSKIQYLAEEMNMIDFIAEEDVVITLSNDGYIKRTASNEYRQQRRGGRGSKGSGKKASDWIEHLFIASTHHTLLFFTEKGRCYWLKVYEIPEGEKTTKGRAIQNLIQIDNDDRIKAIIDIADFKNETYLQENYIILCTKQGTIKKTVLEDFSRPRANGIIAISIEEGDKLIEARLTNGSSEIMMALQSGNAIRFKESEVRPTGRGAIGVRGISVDDTKDEVVGMICISNEALPSVLVVSEHGYGKRTSVEEYRTAHRGGKGVKTINVTDKTGNLVGFLEVKEENDLMITCKSGITIRMSVNTIREAGRNTQGVRLINLNDNDSIAAIACLDKEEEEEVNNEEENSNEEQNTQ